MASFDTLPSAVIRRIYNYATYSELEWQTNAVYASICQHWRAAIIPSLYSHVFFYQEDIIDDSNDGPTGIQQGCWSTNISLVKSLRMVGSVEKVSITTLGIDGTTDLIKNASAYFDFPANDWKSVSCLFLNNPGVSTQHTDISTSNAIYQLADLLTSSMPNILDLTYGDYYEDEDLSYADVLFSRLVKNLAPGLKILRAPLIEMNSHFIFNNLTHLDIGLRDITSYPDSVINPDTLQVLSLVGISAANIWSLFIPTNGSVVFTNLNSLHLCFEETRESDSSISNDTKVLFPKLRKLHVQYYPDSYDIFTICEFSKHLTHISCYFSYRVLTQIYDNISSLGIDSMKVELGRYQDNSHHDVPNSILVIATPS